VTEVSSPATELPGGATLRPAADLDPAGLLDFFRRLPEGDRTFFKEDVLDEHTVAEWTRPGRARRSAVVEDDGTVRGFVSVLPLVGWSSHVGEVRLVVDPEFRGRGLGRALGRAALLQALELGLGKVFVEVVADQEPAVVMFSELGFEPEALLRSHVRDRTGALRDLMVLSHLVDDTWSGLATSGVQDELS
jgi:GNAT superfamily N-acetyltransferase